MKSMKAIILAVLTLAVFASAGGHTAVFLNMPVGWRNIALGGSGVALGGDPIAGWFNPAGIQKMRGAGVSSGYSVLALDRSMTYVSGGWNIQNDAAVALSWVHTGAGEIAGRNISGNYTDDIQYGEDAIFLTFSKVVTPNFNIAGNVKYIQARLDEMSTYVVGFDAGVYGEAMNKSLSWGAVYQNINMKYQWNSADVYGSGNASSADDDIPANLKAGAAYRLGMVPITATAEVEYYRMDEFRFRAGVLGNPIEEATLAVGIDNGLPTFGAGYEFDAGFGKFGAGYSFRWEREGLSPRHSFDITARF